MSADLILFGALLAVVLLWLSAIHHAAGRRLWAWTLLAVAGALVITITPHALVLAGRL